MVTRGFYHENYFLKYWVVHRIDFTPKKSLQAKQKIFWLILKKLLLMISHLPLFSVSLKLLPRN